MNELREVMAAAGEAGMDRRLWRRRAVVLGLTVSLVALVGLASGADIVAPPQAAGPGLVPGGTEPGEPVRQSEAQAVAAAKATGRAIEVGSARGERREVWANPDGTFTERHYQQPVRVIQNGRWVPVDPTLVRHGDGTVAPKAAAVGMRLSGGGNTPLATVQRAGRQLSLTWPAPLPSPVLQGDTATYPEVLAGVDLVVHVSATGFSHVLVVKTPAAARQPALSEIVLRLHTVNLKVQVNNAGRLEAIDPATGGQVFEAPTPGMWDSGDPALTLDRSGDWSGEPPTRSPVPSARRAALGLRVDAGQLSLIPDQAMLTDPSTRFPVYIDPEWYGTSASFWTMVDSGYPTTTYPYFDGNYQNTNNERIGYCPVHTGQCNNSKVKRLFYALPTPYAGKTVLYAELRVTMVHTYDGSARGVSLFRTGGIGSATNWNNQPAWSVWQDSRSPTATQSSCTATNQNVGFIATAGVQEAAAYGWGTTTFGIKADNESDYRWVKRFCENAVLSVQYNRAPYQAGASDLSSNPGGSCVSGSTRPYVSTPPRLQAILRDPDTGDAEPLSAEFKVIWTPNGGTLQTKTWISPQLNNGSTFTYDLADPATGVPTLPENVVVSWEVRASDGTAWGPWSADGPANPCEFILDKTKPAGPDIDSPEFLPLDQPDTTPNCVADANWYDGVGRYGTFTFDSASPDVYKYEYGFDTTPSPANTLTPATDGGPVSVTWLAQTEGPHSVQVRAVDRAGKTSDTTTCIFRVAAGTPPAAQWALADDPGSTAAADERGANPATAGAGVTFGVPGPGGAADRAIHLTGATDSYLATTSTGLVGTDNAFAVSAWVKLGDTSRTQTVVSQDGTGEPGFVLSYDAGSQKWMLQVPLTDVESLGTYQTLSAAPAVRDEWAHLVAVQDPVKRTISIYVNGGTPTVVARPSAWKAYGALQIGRRLFKGGYGDHFTGDVADVTVFNRIVTPAEVAQLGTLKPVRQGYWDLHTAAAPAEDPDVLISPEYSGGQDLTLYNGASVYAPDPNEFPPPEPALVGAGHLVLDGTDDYAATATPIAQTDGSFTVTARVRLASECTRDMVVLSQPGTHTSAFMVECSVASGAARWQLVMPHDDTIGTPAVTTVYNDQRLPNTAEAGQHLALVYDGFLNEVRLYVDGELTAAGKGTHTATWAATGGGLQVGRTKANGIWRDYLAGVVDEIRVYTGVLDQATVQKLANPTEQTEI